MKLHNNQLYIGYAELLDEGISKGTIDFGKNRFDKKASDSWEYVRIEGRVYFRYDALPPKTKSKLSDKSLLRANAKLEQVNSLTDSLYKQLLYAKENKFIIHRNRYKEQYNISNDKALAFGQKHAVWECFLPLYTGKKGELECALEAFNRLGIYKKPITTTSGLSNKIKEARKPGGIEKESIDKRLFSSPKNVKRVKSEVETCVQIILSSGKKISGKRFREKIWAMCDEIGIKRPCRSHIDGLKRKILHGNITIAEKYFGSDYTKSKLSPYTTRNRVSAPNVQFQIDGMDIPLVMDNKYKLVFVIDVYSMMIVGYCIGKSESRLEIISALSDAFAKGYAPKEIVMDKHSATRTKEFSSLIEKFERIGTKTTITINPQYKSPIERNVKTLITQYFSEYAGSTGEGIKTRNINGRNSIDYTHCFGHPNKLRNESEVKAITLAVINEYNKSHLKAGKTPLEWYSDADKSNSIALTPYDRAELFYKETTLKVGRGQINLTIAGHKYEYSLSANLYAKYNGNKVIVRYEQPEECVYLFDVKTGKPIDVLAPKVFINGAKADQTDDDLSLLGKHAAHIKAIKHNSKKEIKNNIEKALEQNPDLINVFKSYAIDKDIRSQIEQDQELKRLVEEHGIDPEKLPIRVHKTVFDEPFLNDNKVDKNRKYPFAVKPTELRKVNITDFDN